MTRKKRLLQRIIALVLIAALWWQTDSMRFFCTAFAAENSVSEGTNLSSDNESTENDTTDEDIPVTVLGEVETLRSEGEKHFRMSDGSFMAVSYGMPVHYQDEDGSWQDIDNRMVLSEDQTTYQTYNLQSITNFASSLTEGILFETSYEDTSVTMSLLDTISADNMMKAETETEPETELEQSTEVLEQSTEVSEQSIVEIVQSNEVLETEPDSVEEELQTETQEQVQEVIAEIESSDLLVFDRTAIADTTVEVQDVLGSVSDVSQADNKDKGWTMEDILPENIQDSLLYEDVFPDVDLLYTKYSHNVKEQIIVNSAQTSYRYDFKLTLDGVEAVLNADGSVSLVEEENHEKEIYYIPAPFMQDADGTISYDVEYVITTVSDGIILTVVADADWMNADERVFPVAIDPTVIVSVGEKEGDIYAVYTAQGSPDSSYNGSTFYAGYTEWHSMKEYRAFLHFNSLPEIPAGMTVVDGQLHLYLYGFSNVGYTDLDFGIYPVTSSKPSTASDYKTWINGLTWNTMPTYDTANMIDYTNISESTLYKYHYWDITELVKKWYIEDTENRTVALTMVPGEYDDTHYVEAQFATYETTAPPVIAVSYRSTVGIEPYYTYQTMGVGDAGVAYIADATGQLKVVNPLITYASTINPFALSLVYNSDYFADDADLDYQPPTKMGSGNIAMKVGQGWTLDIIQTMQAVSINSDLCLCYTDGDGTKHYFIKDDERNSEDDSDKTFWYDEDGLGLKAEITNTATTDFIMYDDSGNSWTFTNGRLSYISDEAANAYSISWNSSNQIIRIVQVNRTGAPLRVAEFTYSGEYVSSITDAAGNTCSFTYTNGKLTGISRNGEQTASYYYPGNANYPTSIRDVKSGYTRMFVYTNGKISAGTEHVNAIHGKSFYISYPNYSKTVYRTTSEEGTLLTSYLFDYWGRTVNAYVTDAENNILGASNAVYTDTQADTSENSVSKKTNRTEKIGGIGVSNPTLFLNGGCESAGWAFHANTTEGHSVSYDNTCHRTGNFSIKMVSENTESVVYASVPSINLTSGETYTLSAYVKTTECSSFSGEGIALKVNDAAGNTFIGKGLSYATSSGIDDGWTRIRTTFTALATGAHTISVYAEGVIGTFYVDDVQLEKGDTAGTLNLLRDGSNETGISQWFGNNITSSVNGGWNNSQCIKLTGHPDNNAYAYQDVKSNLPATETFVLSGWAKGNSVPDNVTTHSDSNQDTKKQFGLRAKITYTDNTSEYHYVPFNPDVSEWQFASLSIVPKCPTKTISTIQVTCIYGGNANVAYFDNICLSREVAQTMKYDDEGNLQSVNTPGLSEDANTYEGGNLIKSVTGGNGTYTYTYDDTYKHRLTGVTDGVITQNLSYDRFGNTVGTALKSNDSSNPLSITSSATYSTDGNRITGLTDSAGNQITYEYDSTSSSMYALPTTTTDGRGNSTTTAYDSEGRTTEVAVPELVSISYAYEQGRLTSIEREDIEGESTQEYRFTYDIYGRTTAVYIGDKLLASYTYRSTGEMTSMSYANGTTINYDYDILGRVIKETFTRGDSNGRIVEYTYDSNGQINSIKDNVSGITNYVYDKLGRLVYYENEETDVRCRYTYDENNRLIYTGYQLEDMMGSSEQYAYNSNSTDAISDGTLTGMQLATTLGLSRKVDYLQRLTERTLPVGLVENYTYASGESENTTTTQVSGKKNTVNGTVISDFQYTYDENGNIRVIYDKVTGEGVAYTYDALNQLTGASYSSLKTESYTYDGAGNLLTFNNGITSHTYTYGNSDWKDLLTAVDGVAFIYDPIGNPVSYYNGSRYILNWTEGRKLATIVKEGKRTDYLYDASGSRIKKINADGSYICYVNADGKMLGEKHYNAEGELTKSLRYIYDENGSVCGYMANTDGTTWKQYYFVTNLQGDIIQVYSLIGRELVASYSYDSWGNIISATGELAEENPFRYRGYYYDSESGFYATGSRYYDPEIGRFINSDGYVSTEQDVTGYNMFAYCGNNPINRKDPTGQFWITALIFTAVVVGCALTLTSCGTQPTSDVGAAQPYVDMPESDDETSPNCYAYAIGSPVNEQPGGASGRIPTKWNDVNDVGKSVEADLKAKGHTVRVISGPDAKVYDNEFKIALRVGTKPFAYDSYTGQLYYDYHFMRQTNTGQWAEKHGYGGASILWDVGMTPDTIPWTLNGVPYYDSEIIYYAVGN